MFRYTDRIFIFLPTWQRKGSTNRSVAKPDNYQIWFMPFPRPFHQLPGFMLSFDWLIVLFAALLIGLTAAARQALKTNQLAFQTEYAHMTFPALSRQLQAREISHHSWMEDFAPRIGLKFSILVVISLKIGHTIFHVFEVVSSEFFILRCHGGLTLSDWGDETSDDKTTHASSHGK